MFSRARLFLSAISYRPAVMLVKHRPQQGGRMAENLPAADPPAGGVGPGQQIYSPSVKSSCFVLTPALWCLHPVHRGASSRGVVKVGRDAAPARAAQRKPPPRAALGKPPRGTKTAGSVRLAVNAKAVMPRGASRDAGARVMCARDPAIRVRPSNRAVRRNPDNAPSRRVTPLISRGRKETGRPRARPKGGANQARLFDK